jgi:hypothetical protein
MTEPDEALIWARERAKADWLECDDETGTLHAAAEDFPSGDSDHFEDIEWRAEAYRAGQAASAERIKALEGSIREALRLLNEYADMTLEEWDDTIADNGAACWMLIRAQLKAVVVADLNRALLKEADQ